MNLNDLVRLMFRASQTQHGLLLRVSDTGRALRAFARAKESVLTNPEAPDGIVLPPVKFRVLDSHPEGNLAILPTRPGIEGEEV